MAETIQDRLRGCVTKSGGVDMNGPQPLIEAADRLDALEGLLTEAWGWVLIGTASAPHMEQRDAAKELSARIDAALEGK